MHELIGRLVKATGPDRALDCAIAAMFGILDDFDPAKFIVPVTYRVSDDERMVEAWTTVPGQEPWRQAGRTPRKYTASLDAALTLVPDGWQWQASNRAPKPKAGRAYIHNKHPISTGVGGLCPNPKYEGHEVTAATAPLALCIVSLMAHSQPIPATA